MNISLPAVVAFTVGNVFVYAAVKNKDPRDVIKEAMGIIPPGSGAPLVPPSGGGGGGGLPNPLGAAGRAAQGAGRAIAGAGASAGHLAQDATGHRNLLNVPQDVTGFLSNPITRGINAVGNGVSRAAHAIGSGIKKLFGH